MASGLSNQHNYTSASKNMRMGSRRRVCAAMVPYNEPLGIVVMRIGLHTCGSFCLSKFDRKHTRLLIFASGKTCTQYASLLYIRNYSPYLTAWFQNSHVDFLGSEFLGFQDISPQIHFFPETFRPYRTFRPLDILPPNFNEGGQRDINAEIYVLYMFKYASLWQHEIN